MLTAGYFLSCGYRLHGFVSQCSSVQLLGLSMRFLKISSHWTAVWEFVSVLVWIRWNKTSLMQNCNSDNGATAHFKRDPANKERSGSFVYNQLYIWNSPTWMMLQRRTFSYREVAAVVIVQRVETIEIWVRDRFCRLCGNNRRNRQHFLSLSFLRSRQPHDAASSGNPHHERTKQSHSKGHFLKLFILWIPFSPKIAFRLALPVCMPIDRLPSRKPWLRGFIAGRNQEV